MSAMSYYKIDGDILEDIASAIRYVYELNDETIGTMYPSEMAGYIRRIRPGGVEEEFTLRIHQNSLRLNSYDHATGLHINAITEEIEHTFPPLEEYEYSDTVTKNSLKLKSYDLSTNIWVAAISDSASEDEVIQGVSLGNSDCIPERDEDMVILDANGYHINTECEYSFKPEELENTALDTIAIPTQGFSSINSVTFEEESKIWEK